MSGKVTANGQPVTGGTLTFAPEASAGDINAAGPSVVATIQSDGTYTVASGATVGKNHVIFGAPPPPAGSSTAGQAVASPFANLVPKQSEVELKSGDNKIDIELAPK